MTRLGAPAADLAAPANPPYRAAALAGCAVLIGYLITLAPTVTFWDAGEFITAARTLGIPHPPGTPLFVLLTNVWGRIIPVGAYAWRINLFSAVCGAIAAGCWFLVVHDLIHRLHTDVDARSRAAFATLGGCAAALLVSFTFTTWQNSTETEVYAAATLAIALVAWLATRWRTRRFDAGGARLLLAAVYVGALSVGTHVMGLLAGPALLACLIVTARHDPLPEPQRASEWAMIGVVGAAWVVLIGVGLANGPVTAGGVVLFVVASWRARSAGAGRFAAIAAVVIVVGVSTLLFLLFRAQQHPWLDQAMPSTWHNLLAVVRRAQYAPRGPLDDPTLLHGPGNPGRTLTLLAYQVANYAQYFDWQWSAGFGELDRASLARLVVTLLMAAIGLRGVFAQRRGDPASFALVGTLFLVTGPLLLLYLNFKPGPSIGWDRWTALADHEVRDRDYFFVASFVAWGVWVAIGVVDIARTWIPRFAGRRRTAVAGVFAVALVPLAANFRAATRRQTPEATFARDFAHALLQSVPPNGVLFTWGDNDTFPLWYAQQVEGFRPDVTVVCLALAQTTWYVKLIRTQPHSEPRRDQLPAVWRDAPIAPVTGPLHGMDDAAIDAIRPFRTTAGMTLDLGPHGVARVAAGSIVFPMDVTVLEVLRTNAGHRPVAWSITAADELLGLGPHLIQQGMALVMPAAMVDPTRLVGGAAAGPGGVPLDLFTTRQLIEAWNFGRLETEGASRLEANIGAVASTVVAPMVQAGAALALQGDTASAVRMLRRAVRIADDSAAKAILKHLSR